MSDSNEQIDNISSAPPAGSVAETEQGIWSAIRESIRGSHRDYTVGPIGRAVILLAIPMCSRCSWRVCSRSPTYSGFSSGPEAAATVGLTESLMTLVYALAIGLSIGATATVRAALVNETRTARLGQRCNQSCWRDRSDRDRRHSCGRWRQNCSAYGCFAVGRKTGSNFTRIMLAATRRLFCFS